MNAARALRVARKRVHLSQTELAKRAGVPKQVVNAIERATSVPRFDTLDRLLAAAGADLLVVPRGGAGVDRAGIEDLLDRSPEKRLTVPQVAALNVLCDRRVWFVLVGDAAARFHGAPVAAERLEVVLGLDHRNTVRLRKARRSAAVCDLVVPVDGDSYRLLKQDAEELPWRPHPTMRVFDDYIDVCTGFVASLDELCRTSKDPERLALLAAVQEEIDRRNAGYRMNRDRFDGRPGGWYDRR